MPSEAVGRKYLPLFLPDVNKVVRMRLKVSVVTVRVVEG